MAETTAEVTESKTKKKVEEVVQASAKKELKLTDLKVADLRTELENRGLDKTGVKAALVERLKKAIEEEGENPEEYLFETASDGLTPVKKSKRIKEALNESKPDSENEVEDEEIEDTIEEKTTEEPLIIDAGENGEILQLSLDDKEINLEGKDSLENKLSDNEDDEVKVEAVRSSGKGIKNTEVLETKEAELKEEPATKESSIVTLPEVITEPKPTVETKEPLEKESSKEDKNKSASPDKNVWVTGLASSTRAADLKTLFSKQGKVVSVKIVTNARQISGEKKYYGFVRMATNKDALKAVQQLHKTDLNGQVIFLEVTKDQPGTLLKRMVKPAPKKTKTDAIKSPVTPKAKKDTEAKDGKASESEEAHDKDKDDKGYPRRDRDREHRSRDSREYNRDYYRGSFRRPFGGYRGRMRGRGYSNFRDRAPIESSFRRPFGRTPFYNNSRRGFRSSMKPNFVPNNYQKMRDERMSRDRFREREIRESERRRAQEAFHHKMVERKQREEAYRLEREKVQLRIEREILERERAEILKMEREKQRVERERLEREKEKLRRQTQMRDTGKRPYPRSPPETPDVVWEKDKRVRYDSRYPPKPFAFTPKAPMESRPNFREPPSDYSRHKFEPRPSSSNSNQYDRDGPLPQSSRSDFGKYSKEKPAGPSGRDHDERRVYKRSYFKEDTGRSNYMPSREAERYPPPQDDRGFKRKVHDAGPRVTRGGRGRRMPYY